MRNVQAQFLQSLPRLLELFQLLQLFRLTLLLPGVYWNCLAQHMPSAVERWLAKKRGKVSCALVHANELTNLHVAVGKSEYALRFV